MVPRKLWRTASPSLPALDRRHPSETAAYRWIAERRAEWQNGRLLSSDLVVYVDERDGHGWQIYERIDLAEGAS